MPPRDLGPLEMQVLGLFELSEPASVADIQARLERSGTHLAYTTVMTVLSRLHEKGAITRKRDGKRYLYATSRQTGIWVSGIVGRMHRALFKSDRMQPIAKLLEEDGLSVEELRTLRKLVDAKLEGRAR
jgi:predicted transcriptional regulator